MRRTLFLCCCLAAGLAQGAELYRWVDADGKVHYTDQQPPASAKQVEEKNLGNNTIDASELPYATRQAIKNSPVTLYATDCGSPCTQAREHLVRRGIPYTAKNPQTSAADAQSLQKLIGELYVPVLEVGSTVRKGYGQGNWDAALDAAGYPKNAQGVKALTPAKPADKSEKNTPEPRHPWAGGR